MLVIQIVIDIAGNNSQGKWCKKIRGRSQKPYACGQITRDVLPLLRQLHKLKYAAFALLDKSVQVVVEGGLIDLEIVFDRSFECR
jgi:hypothetical protein